MDFRVQKSDDGRIFVQSKNHEFVASYKDGEWINDIMFDPYELLEIPVVDNAKEVQVIVDAAKRSLNRW